MEKVVERKNQPSTVMLFVLLMFLHFSFWVNFCRQLELLHEQRTWDRAYYF